MLRKYTSKDTRMITYNKEAYTFAELEATPCTIEERWIHIETLATTTIDNINLNLIDEMAGEWKAPIKNYLKRGTKPNNPMENKRLRNKVAYFFTNRGRTIHKRSLRRSIPNGVYNQQRRKDSSQKYSWRNKQSPPRSEEFDNTNHQARILLANHERRGIGNSTYLWWVLVTWEHTRMPINNPHNNFNISSILKKGSGQCRSTPKACQCWKYIFTAKDYFAKWIEAEEMRTIIGEIVVKFVF